MRLTHQAQRLECVPKQSRINYLQKALQERLALKFDLFTETVVRYQLDVLQTVLSRDSYIAPVRNQVVSLVF